MLNKEYRRIALSSSYFNFPEIQKLLSTCDKIYTTQVEHRDALYSLFGNHKVFFIPESSQSMMELIKSWHGVDVEYITFSDLFRLVNYENETEEYATD